MALKIKWLDKAYVHQRALRISAAINRHLAVEGIELIKLQYGVELFLTDFYKLVPILMLSMVTQSLVEFALVFLTFRWIRAKAFGVHAETSLQCLVVSLTLFVFGVNVMKTVPQATVLVWFMGLATALMLACFAPNDTANNPLIGSKVRSQLRRESLMRFCGVVLGMGINPWAGTNIYLMYGMFIAAILPTPLAYKLLKRRMNNYEAYEING